MVLHGSSTVSYIDIYDSMVKLHHRNVPVLSTKLSPILEVMIVTSIVLFHIVFAVHINVSMRYIMAGRLLSAVIFSVLYSKYVYLYEIALFST